MEQKALTLSLNKFAAEFCNELNNTTSVCSPVSAEIALALLALGSKNESHAEILKALGFPDDDAIRSAFSFLTSNLKVIKDTLKVATKLYLRKGEYELKSHLKKDAEEVFDAALEQIDFGKGKAAADEINAWVAGQTNDKIKDIISADMMDGSTHILLLNAIYFKGAWQIPFKKDLTEDRPFHVNNQSVINVPMMMVTKERFRAGCSVELDAELLELKYSSNDTRMVIILPNEVEGLQSVLQKLVAGHDLMSDLEALHEKDVDVTMPKFKAETTTNLKKVLPKLGIKAIFDCSADIDMLTPYAKLYVSGAIQKAFIDINEEGTEAAA